MKHKKIIQTIKSNPPSITDPQGSYTGQPEDEAAIPVQDADDL